MRARAGWLGAAALRACRSYTSWRRSSHRGLQRAARTTKIHADDACRGLEVDSAAAPARAGVECAAALVEDQARTQVHATHRGGAGGGPEPTQRQYQGGLGAGAAAPVEDRGPMDIEVARRRCHEPTAVRQELGLGWPV